MNMPIPGVSVTEGPQWASDINACLTIIDGHDHASGEGVQINPAGININSDLAFNSNNAVTLRSARFSPQSAPLALAADIGCLYESGVDLWYNDGLGNQVRITQSGGVAGSPGSISNLTPPASAAYVSANGAFVWQQAANTSADMDFGSAIMRNDTANSKGLTLSPPAAMGSDYSLTLPSLPGSTLFMTLDASGNMGTASNVQGTQIADGSITRAKLGPVGQQVSASSGSFSSSSGSYVSAGISVTITTTGKPVFVGLIGAASNSPSPAIGISRNGTSTGVEADFGIARDGTGITIVRVANAYPSNASLNQLYVPPSSLWMIDVVGAGTYTYTCIGRLISGDAFQVTESKLVAYEL